MEDLLTERLVLHPFTVAEAERLVAAGAAPEGGYPTAMDVAGARRYLEVCARDGDPRPFGAFEVRVRADGRAIGGAGFHGAPDDEGAVTIGYGLIEAARGHGYAAETLRELLRFARAAGAARVKGDTDRGNVASQRVMAAAGMRLVAEDDELRYYELGWPEPAVTVL
ncbi:GNAT family N-acetyltransferase [Actinomadura violacea]|uniref:GNAT family N-acetyltransferase n=1 Tax=Actinomadura violacea TaxID=2819934 RepID=A0ABS3SCT8_9ACTN|nr:GNAT family N-acetyltransferase [Actinomadura violacea]MBO2466060.1 GNAT family N-acetyltransferase [Actinomadura violacea]